MLIFILYTNVFNACTVQSHKVGCDFGYEGQFSFVLLKLLLFYVACILEINNNRAFYVKMCFEKNIGSKYLEIIIMAIYE